MYYCRKCGFYITGTAKKCPFCQGDLSGEPEGENIFPEIPFKEPKSGFLIRLSALGTIIAAAVCIAINYSWQEHGWWSAFVTAGLLSVWIAAGIAIKKHGNPLKAVLWQVCAGSLLILAWDYWTGFRGWSLDFAMPVLYICSSAMTLMLVWFMRLKPQDYLVYLVWNLLLGLIPLALLFGGALRITLPSVICVLVSTAGLAVLVLFKGSALWAEIIRRFHL